MTLSFLRPQDAALFPPQTRITGWTCASSLRQDSQATTVPLLLKWGSQDRPGLPWLEEPSPDSRVAYISTLRQDSGCSLPPPTPGGTPSGRAPRGTHLALP